MACSKCKSYVFSIRTRTIALLMGILGCVLYVVCFVTPSWVSFTYKTLPMNMGLFLECIHGDCTTAFVQTDGLILLSQICGCAGLALYMIFCITATLTMFWTKHWKKKKGIRIATGIIGIIAGVFLPVAIAMIIISKKSYGAKMGYSSYLGIVADAILLLISPFYIFDGCFTKKPDTPLIPRKEKKFDNIPVIPGLAPENTFIDDPTKKQTDKMIENFVHPKPMPPRAPFSRKSIDIIKKKLMGDLDEDDQGGDHSFRRSRELFPPPVFKSRQSKSEIIDEIHESDESDDEDFVHPKPGTLNFYNNVLVPMESIKTTWNADESDDEVNFFSSKIAPELSMETDTDKVKHVSFGDEKNKNVSDGDEDVKVKIEMTENEVKKMFTKTEARNKDDKNPICDEITGLPSVSINERPLSPLVKITDNSTKANEQKGTDTEDAEKETKLQDIQRQESSMEDNVMSVYACDVPTIVDPETEEAIKEATNLYPSFERSSNVEKGLKKLKAATKVPNDSELVVRKHGRKPIKTSSTSAGDQRLPSDKLTSGIDRSKSDRIPPENTRKRTHAVERAKTTLGRSRDDERPKTSSSRSVADERPKTTSSRSVADERPKTTSSPSRSIERSKSDRTSQENNGKRTHTVERAKTTLGRSGADERAKTTPDRSRIDKCDVIYETNEYDIV